MSNYKSYTEVDKLLYKIIYLDARNILILIIMSFKLFQRKVGRVAGDALKRVLLRCKELLDLLKNLTKVYFDKNDFLNLKTNKRSLVSEGQINTTRKQHVSKAQ